MKLKKRILSGILTIFAGLCAFMPTVGAMDGDVNIPGFHVPTTRQRKGRDSLVLCLSGRPAKERNDALFCAVRMNDWGMIANYCSSNRDGINMENGSGDTPLLAAVKNNSLTCIIQLLKYNETNMNALTMDGKTMWHILLEGHKWSAIEILLGVEGNSMVDRALVERCKKNFNEFMKKIDTANLSDVYINTLKNHLPPEVVNANKAKLRVWCAY